jgi:nitrite reductase/ring-hydroxylating ferredoxin subunit
MEKVCEVLDLKEGKMRGFTVKHSYILLANVNGNFYAIDAICPHLDGFLPFGNLENDIIKCPVHGSQYDVTTGKLVKDVPALTKLATGGESHDLNSFPVTVKDDAVFIEL